MKCINATSLRRKSGQMGHPAFVASDASRSPRLPRLAVGPERSPDFLLTRALTSGHACCFDQPPVNCMSFCRSTFHRLISLADPARCSEAASAIRRLVKKIIDLHGFVT